MYAMIKLPQLIESNQVTTQEVKRNDDEAKAKIKVHADIWFKAKPFTIDNDTLVQALHPFQSITILCN